MNKGQRGGAYGFRVASLNKIADTKSSIDRWDLAASGSCGLCLTPPWPLPPSSPVHMCCCFGRVQFFATHGLQPTRLLCPWDSPGRNTGVGCHVLLQGSSQPGDQTCICLCLLHCRSILYPLSHRGSPAKIGHSFPLTPQPNFCQTLIPNSLGP